MSRKSFVTAIVIVMIGTFTSVLAQYNLKDLPGVGWIINTAEEAAQASVSNNAVVTVNEGQTANNNGIFSNLPEPINVTASVGAVTTATVVLNLDSPFSTALDETFLRISNDGLRAYFSTGKPGGFGGQDIYTVQRNSINTSWGSPVNLGSSLNTPTHDYSAFESRDGLTLYFDRNNGDIFKAVRLSINTPWNDPGVVVSSAEFINIDAANSFNFHPTVSQDGLTLIFQRNNINGLMVSTRANTSANWSTPAALNHINAGTTTYHPALAPDGLTLYFDSDRPGSLGQFDIYKAVRANTGVPWTSNTITVTPVAEANTIYQDAAPFFGLNTLYFASPRPGGFGDHDSYYLSKQWSWTFTTDDNAADSQTVTITGNDGNGAMTDATFDLVVNNVDPTAAFANGGAVSEGSTGSVSFSNQSDPSSADIMAGFRYAYDFDNDSTFEVGDGAYNNSVTNASATVPANFLASPGTRVVRGRIIDKDGGYTNYTTTITINPLAATATVVQPASADYSPNNQSIALNATVTSGNVAVNAGTMQFTVKDGNGNIIGTPVSSPVSSGNASAAYTLPGATSTQSLIITAEYSNNGAVYQISSGTNLLTISKATPTITWAANQADITYGIPLGAAQFNATASVPGDIAYTPAAGTVLNAGNNQTLTVNFTPTDTTNYNPAVLSVSINVLKAALTIKSDDKSRTYGEAPVLFSVTPTGFVNGDTLSSLGGTLAFNFADAANKPAGTYTIIPSGLTSNNYDITFRNGTLTINKAALNITADDKTRVYGAANPPLTGTITGVLNTDGISATYSTTSTSNSPIGNYDITISLVDPNNRLGNYEVTADEGTMTVYKALLSVIADDKTRQYGTVNPLLTGTVAGIQNGENITASYSTTATQSSDAGDYSIVPQLSGSTLSNYQVTAVNGALNITKVPQMILWSNPAEIIYGTPLGAAQLNAAVSVVGPAAHGAVTYAPAAGTTLNAGDAQSLTVNAAETNNYLPATASVIINVAKAPSAIKVFAPAFIANGGNADLSGVLTGVGSAPLAGRSVVLSIGSGTSAQNCAAVTNANGAASCTITGVNQMVGPNLPVTSTFAGDGNHLASSGAATTLVYAYPTSGAGAFVIGDGNPSVGQTVTFWGSQWAKKNSLTGSSAPSSFKGFVNRTTTTPPNCGLTWISDPGNSSNPPQTIPAYIAVIVSSSIIKNGSTISGDTPKVVIVKTNPGYGPNPGSAGTGTVVSVLCQ